MEKYVSDQKYVSALLVQRLKFRVGRGGTQEASLALATQPLKCKPSPYRAPKTGTKLRSTPILKYIMSGSLGRLLKSGVGGGGASHEASLALAA